MVAEFEPRAEDQTSSLLSTEDLCARWLGLSPEGTLRNWRVLEEGPDFIVLRPYGARHVIYPLHAVQAYELKHSSIPRKIPWSGRFLSVEDLLERWRGGPHEVTANALREWRTARGRHNGPAYVTIHVRHLLYPIEAVRFFERCREEDRLAREKALLDLGPVGPTYGEILMQGPPV